MLRLFCLLFLFFYSTVGNATNPYLMSLKRVNVYVDISDVYINGEQGTSEELNQLLFTYSNFTGGLNHRIQRLTAHEVWHGKIYIYNRSNLDAIPSFQYCDYTNSIKCGKVNNHWTLKTRVNVGKKFSSLNLSLYDESGQLISTSIKTVYGKIVYKPQWKLTKVSEKGGFGGNKETEIFEMYPPKIEELPPLITPFYVHQAVGLLYLSIRM